MVLEQQVRLVPQGPQGLLVQQVQLDLPDQQDPLDVQELQGQGGVMATQVQLAQEGLLETPDQVVLKDLLDPQVQGETQVHLVNLDK